MSLYISEANESLAASAACRFTLPTGAANKSANQACTTLLFFRTPVAGFDQAGYTYRWVLSRNVGGTNSHDADLSLTSDCTTIRFRLRVSSTQLVGINVPGLTPGTDYAVFVIINPSNTHLVVCPVGGAPLTKATAAVSTPYSNALLSSGNGALWDRIAAPNTASFGAYYGLMEEFCFWTGTFPETSGTPDMALIEAIANGTQDLAGVAALMTAGALKFRYAMTELNDLSDASGQIGALTANNVDATEGKVSHLSGPLRPVAMKPDFTGHCASQVVFGTRGDAATAFADINVEGGAYTGITPAAVYARLIQFDGTVVRAWEVADASPSAGRWDAYTFTDVPMTQGWLIAQFEARDGSGNVLAKAASYGLKGAGFCAWDSGQSQGVIGLYTTGGSLALPANACVSVSLGDGLRLVSPANSNSRGIGRGGRSAVAEIYALHPGVPVSFIGCGQTGTPITQFYGGGTYAGRYATRKDAQGIMQPFIFAPWGHSDDAGPSYATQLTALIDHVISALGVPLKILHIPVPRYSRAGGTSSSGNRYNTQQSRRGAWTRFLANRATDYMGHDMSVVSTSELTSSDPHPNTTATGSGRSGSLYGYSWMAAIGACLQEPQMIKSARKVGTSVELTIGPVND